MIPSVGQMFGPFEILGRLGGGGMGLVFQAWDSRLHREVAIKILHTEFGMPAMRERFLREARAASALNHVNICTIFDIGEQDGDPYLVMELLHGQTLKDRIVRGAMSVGEIVALGKDCAEALGAAHAKGIVHRDVKPANIFLVDKEKGFAQTKVLDFGLAQVSPARGSRALPGNDLTTVGATVGTLAYMSPEQARGEVLDSRSDLFSLGVVLYEMAARQIPFPGATSALVFVKLLNEAPEPVREWNESIPRELDRVIQRLLAKDRAARYQTAEELVEALDKVAERPGGGWLSRAMAAVPLGRSSGETRRPRVEVAPEVEAITPEAAEPAGAAAAAGASWEDANEEYKAKTLRSTPLASERTASELPGKEDSARLLRPVARIPKNDSKSEGAEESRSVTPAPVSGSQTRHAPFAAIPQPRGEGSSGSGRPVSGSGGRPGGGRGAGSGTPGSGAAGSMVSGGLVSGGLVSGNVAPGRLSVLSESRKSIVSRESIVSRDSIVSRESRVVAGQPPLLGMPGSSARRMTAERVPSILWEATLEYEERLEGNRVRRWWVWGLGSVLLVVALGLVLFVALRSRLRAPLLGRQERVVLTAIENRTGDKTFDGSLVTALQMELAQSPYLRLKSGGDYRLTLRQMGANDTSSRTTAREVAKRLGARVYLYGSIRGVGASETGPMGARSGAGAPYTVQMLLLNVDTDATLATVEEQAGSREQMGAAIDRVAVALRSAAGEDGESIARTNVPLAHEATTNFEALHQYAAAEAALGGGHLGQALEGYLQAVALDAHFTQAWLRLVVVYRLLRADAAAEQAARQALVMSREASEHTRLLARFEDEMNVEFNYVQATATVRELLQRYPRDLAAMADESRLLRLQGRLPEALQVAEQGTAEDPLDVASNLQKELALVAMDHYDGALHVQLHLERLGILPPAAGLTAGYLAGRQDVVDASTAWVKTTSTLTPEWREYGLYLDNTGRLEQGRAAWQATARMAQEMPTAGSAASTLLAQGALDRALVGDCKSGLEMAKDATAGSEGHDATFNSGMAFALCGDRVAAEKAVVELQQRYPESTAVKGYFVADLRGAMALQAGDPASALELLKPARQFDLVSLTPFLRGRAHVALGQIEVGIVDFQTVLSHRGITFNVGTNVYPMAQIGVARAFARSGDAMNSADAYRRFLEIWKDADKKQPLMIEAMAKR